MKNKYNLYEVDFIKGMMMYKFIAETLCDNIIQAEDDFEVADDIKTGTEYVITIEKL